MEGEERKVRQMALGQETGIGLKKGKVESGRHSGREWMTGRTKAGAHVARADC